MCFRVKLHDTINSSVPTLPRISKPGQHLKWDDYLDKVYTKRWRVSNKTFDLNTFEWFYWDSPLDSILKPKKVFIYDQVRFNEAWIMPPVIPKQLQNWEKNTCKYPPEGLYNKIGFFVRRKRKKDISLEVLRFKYGEINQTWFYNLRGSGIFLRAKQKFSTSNYHHAFDLREYIVPTYLSRDTTCANLSFQTIAEETCDCDDSLDYLNCM